MGRMITEIPIPSELKRLWNTWDLRIVIILSISLQTILIVVAPLRKRIKSILITMLLWSACLLADFAADYAVGLISISQGHPFGSRKTRTPVENGDLLAFWAPFLLVHLGGPDTITAFSVEDNDLWLRHSFGFVFQCLAAVYVFVRSLPRNSLWIPTLLMFINGTIKYLEKTRSLYRASADSLKPSGPSYAKLMTEYSNIKGKLPTRIQMVPKPYVATKSARKAKKGRLTDLEVVQYGYHYFKKFKWLIADTIFTQRERDESRYFFMERNPDDAFRVVEVELNFIYDVLFTKFPVVYDRYGGIARFFTLSTLCSAIIFFIFESKSKFSKVDVRITYCLLYGGLVLDMASLFMLLFSDWTIIKLLESPDLELDNSLKTRVTTTLLNLVMKYRRFFDKMKLVLRRRWSKSLSTYNLIHHCLHPRSKFRETVFEKLKVIAFLVDLYYLESKDFTDGLRDFIFEELKSKSELADDLETAKEISSARGDCVLRVEEGWSSLLKYVHDVDYDQSLILWHIATELCYYSNDLQERTSSNNHNKEDRREMAKLLSDYMLYLLIMQPSIIPAAEGMLQIRFQDTCAEVKRFLEEKQDEEPKTTQTDLKHKFACNMILDVPTDIPPVAIRGDTSKSLLFDSCILAKELIQIEKDSKLNNMNLDKWEIISKVWVELMCYAANHSHTNSQAAQVSNGGELITIVRLLTAHFGLRDQFEINEDQVRAKIILGK